MCKILDAIMIINERKTLTGKLERLERHLEKALDWRNDPCAFREPWKYIELTRQRIDACKTLIEANEREMVATGMPEWIFRMNPKRLFLSYLRDRFNITEANRPNASLPAGKHRVNNSNIRG